MKIASKIIILVLAVSLAILAIMAIVKTRVEPPVAVNQVDQYTEDLSSLIDNFKKEENPEAQYNMFLNICNRVAVFNQENKIGKKGYDKCIKNVVEIYAPKFIAQSFDKFAKSVWNADDHTRMLEISAYLKSLKLSTGKLALTKDNSSSLNQIEGIIADYRAAWAIARSTSYQGIDRARANIVSANNYRSKQYISNCTALMTALANVPNALHNSHWNYLVAQVEKLRNYSSYSSEAYYAIVEEVDNQINIYMDNAASVYGSMKDAQSLRSRAGSYISNYPY